MVQKSSKIICKFTTLFMRFLNRALKIKLIL